MGMFIGRDNDESFGGGATWSTSSRIDSRFNMSGRCSSLWTANAEATKAIDAKAAQLGVEPPSDLECGAVKD